MGQDVEGEGRFPLGRACIFRLSWGEPLLRWGPAWAVLCGAVASGARPSGLSFLILLLALFLTEGALSALWELGVEKEWGVPSQGHSVKEEALPLPPYTRPHSPAHRLWRRLGRLWAWWRGEFWPRHGQDFLSLMAVSVLTVLVAVLLGRWVVLAVGMALVMEVLTMRARRGKLFPLLARSLVEMGVAWTIGYGAFRRPSFPSLALAGFHSFSYFACLVLSQGGGFRRAFLLLNAGQAATGILLVALREPLWAGLTGLLMMPGLLLRPLIPEAGGDWYLGRIKPFSMALMLATALAIRAS